MGADRLALGLVEAAFGAGQQRGRTGKGGEGSGGRRTARFIGEEQPGRPCRICE